MAVGEGRRWGRRRVRQRRRLHPLDVVRTRFQVHDGRLSGFPSYRNTGHALRAISRAEGMRGLYSGLFPAVIGSTVSWGLYFFFYNKAKERYSKGTNKQLSAGHHLVSAAEAGALNLINETPNPDSVKEISEKALALGIQVPLNKVGQFRKLWNGSSKTIKKTKKKKKGAR